MKYVKMLGLLAVAAAALMAFAGSASATVTSPANTEYTGEIVATAKTSTLTGSFVEVVCGHSTIKGTLNTNDEKVASGPVEHLAWTECNYNVTTSTTGGTLTATSIGSNEATISSSNAAVTIHTSVGTCTFTTNSTHLGTLEGGKNAKLAIAAVGIPRTAGNFLCGSKGTWTATYNVTTPGELFVD